MKSSKISSRKISPVFHSKFFWKVHILIQCSKHSARYTNTQASFAVCMMCYISWMLFFVFWLVYAATFKKTVKHHGKFKRPVWPAENRQHTYQLLYLGNDIWYLAEGLLVSRCLFLRSTFSSWEAIFRWVTWLRPRRRSLEKESGIFFPPLGSRVARHWLLLKFKSKL